MSELFLAFDGKHLQVSEAEYVHFGELYPHLDIMQELRFIDEWLYAHPRRRGSLRFIKNWLRAEERKAARPNPELKVGTAVRSEHLTYLAHFTEEEWQRHLDKLDPKRRQA